MREKSKMTTMKLHRFNSLTRLTLVVLCVCATNAKAAENKTVSTDSKDAVVAADSKMQSLFGEFALADDAATREGLWDQLRQLDRTNRAALIQQLTLFASEAQSTRSSMVAGVVIKELKMTGEDVVAALVPMMTTDESTLQKQIKGTLAEFEDQSASRPPDFSMYRALIATEIREGREAPVALVLHMFDVDPGAALIAMTRATQMREPSKIREILWAEHTVSDSIWKQTHGFIDRDTVEPQVSVQLERLANHSEWWARLYVPAAMKRYPVLKSVDLLENLQGDPNETVATAAERLIR